jgi:ParB family chromosome partitioning protein
MAKPGLGRGLGALLGNNPIAAKAPGTSSVANTPEAAPALDSRERVQRVPLSRVVPCPFQPRKDFVAAALQELADSIREQGIVQPLIVRERGPQLELIAGERRWRAAQMVGLAEVPVIVREADDRAVMELALIENLQRENLNPMEEAQGYSQLIEQCKLTQEDVAARVGKSRAAVANALRLLKLPTSVQQMVREGRLSVGHAKVILALATEQHQRSAAERVLKEGLNVRQTEVLVEKYRARESGQPASAKPGAHLNQDSHVVSLENQLRERLGTRIHLRYTHGRGALEIAFFSDAELERILQILGVNPE